MQNSKKEYRYYEVNIQQDNTQHFGKYVATEGKRTTSDVYAVVIQNQADHKCRKADMYMIFKR